MCACVYVQVCVYVTYKHAMECMEVKGQLLGDSSLITDSGH